MEIIDTSRGIEIGIWHNGIAKVPHYQHPINLAGPGYYVLRIPALENAAMAFDVRIEFQPEARITDQYISGRMWLTDSYGQPFAPPRPTLIHAEASDLPMATVFFCTWMETDEDPAPGYGVWVVTTRVTDDYRLGLAVPEGEL